MDTGKWLNITEDEDELEDEYILSSTKDTILFCIDASQSMQSPIGSNGAEAVEIGKRGKRERPKSHFYQALKCALDIMKRKVVISPNDSLGILFFNTAEKKGEVVMANHYLYQPVSQLNSEIITRIQDLIYEAADDPEILTKKFQPVGPRINVPIGDVFASCNLVLRAGAPKTSVKRIFFITNEDDPKSLEGPATKRLEDLAAQGIAMVPFFISTEEKPFLITKFYSNVLSIGLEDDGASPFTSVCEGFEGVINEMRVREMPRRAMWSIPLEIAEGLTIGVKGYGLVTEQRKPQYKYVWTQGGTTKEVLSRTVYTDQDQQTEVKRTKIFYGVKMGDGVDFGLEASPKLAIEGEDDSETEDEDVKPSLKNSRGQGPKPKKVLFTAEEVKEFRTIGLSPGVKILGYKDKSELQFEDNVKHAYFLYPDESKYIGSTRTFLALLRTLVAKDKIAIARVVMRRNMSPAFCAILPQEEVIDESGTQKVPPGLNIIQLPFADEIREPPLTQCYRGSDDLSDAAAAIIKKMTLKTGYRPEAFPNPSLSLHYAFLEANALATEFDPDAIEDHTLPNYDMIHERVGPLMKAWGDQLEKERNANLMFKSSAAKGKKRVASEATEDGPDETEIRARFEAGELRKLTNPVLKAFLKHKGERVASNATKDVLVKHVTAWLDSHPGN
ncbi:ku70-like protein [Cantharellus anzutake]|uniref:ku70-like protein n=1 Tax=Cantharellus anzutake TaxID=1750568 RepID=UPI0019079EC7|nr:ku70-like protein [Cantharellus anzutake]KAF8340621.1 ku70-like protein [Cantharellus anzutake]